MSIFRRAIPCGTVFLFLIATAAFTQPELHPWGNLTGIRAGGQLLRFESSLRVLGPDGRREQATARERYWSDYRREGAAQIVQTRIDSLYFTETIRSGASGTAQIQLDLEPHADMPVAGVFFHLSLPAADFAAATLQQIEPALLQLPEHGALPVGENEILRVRAKGLALSSARREMRVQTDAAGLIVVQLDPATGDLGLYFTLLAGPAQSGQKRSRQFEIQIEGDGKAAPAELHLFPEYPGSVFTGLGGNFRLQNLRDDPKVIDYCLTNLDVRMGRVELPWQLWHPVDTVDPLAAARRGEGHPRVKAAMEMAQRLYRMKMPVLLAAWFPPEWAAEGVVTPDPRHADSTWGNPLRKDRMDAIYASITGYLLYLREAYGVEVAMFSFNESDLGINVRQTPREHAALIKGLGAYMKARGLKTKMLLGDTADANGFAFVNAALDDPETWAYIGAVSFHSWRGWEKSTLLEWRDAADRLDVPLLVGEGSIDAAAWRYPRIFEEPLYALEEIKLYVRLLAICQPQAILQWQLTADYSPLSGGGLYGGSDSLPLQPTQRFWNLKQLSQTPAGLRFLPLANTADDLYAAALGDAKQKTFAFHLVNDGPERDLTLSGLPEKLKRLRVYTTNPAKGMEAGALIAVEGGVARVRLEAASFMSLRSE